MGDRKCLIVEKLDDIAPTQIARISFPGGKYVIACKRHKHDVLIARQRQASNAS